MVMHARKPQRMSDGYFEKHQAHPYQSSKYSSKRDYERDTSSRSSTYGRDRDNSPSTGGGTSLNNGSSSYRSNSPDLESSPRHDIRDRDRDRDRFSYLQKMRERDRDVYKKDKYSDKRDRGRGSERDSEHRTNHDRIDRRSSKLCTTSSSDKRSGSDDRDRDRDRDLRDSKRDRSDRDRDRERDRDRDRDRDRSDRDRERDRDRNDRGDRVIRIGDWSEHVSSSGKMYYYNCKTEISQWEKPKEWMEKERTVAKDQHREYREKDRERDRDDRFSRSSTTYAKHSSTRSSSRLRWPYEAESGPPAHRRRHDENADMDISPGDSTPTSEASYSLSSTPTAQANEVQTQQSSGVPTVSSAATAPGPVLLANALPRLASHPSTPTNSQMHFSTPASAVSGMVQSTTTSTCLSSVQGTSNCHRKLDSVIQTALPVSSPSQSSVGTPSSSGNHVGHHSQSQQQNVQPSGTPCVSDHHLNSNAPGPPPVSLANLPKILSQITGTKQIEQNEINPQKALQTINTALMRQQPQPHHGVLSSIGSSGVSGSEQTSTVAVIGTHNSDSNHSGTGVSNLRENPLNSPLYNLTQMHAMSPLNHNKIAVSGANVVSSYSCNTPFGLKTVESGATSGPGSSLGSSGSISGEGPPTPTQELDLSGSSEPRKLEGTSASLSSLQSCVTSAQSGRSQGPDLSPKLAKYFRADLITHVTNWPAEMLEKQALGMSYGVAINLYVKNESVELCSPTLSNGCILPFPQQWPVHQNLRNTFMAQKCSEDTHIYGDLQCTKVSAELKCARSLVRITEITATLQEQKIMYLRQQIRRLEELKSQNSFMSDDL